MPIRAGGKLTLIHAQATDGDLLALGQRVPFRMGEKEYSLVGGREIPGALMRGVLAGSDMIVRLVYPHPVQSADPWIQEHLIVQASVDPSESILDPKEHFVHDLELFYMAPDAMIPSRGQATLIVGHSRMPLRSMLRNLDIWLGLYLLVILAGTLLLARWISDRISKPLRELADEVTSVDVDRLNVEFASDRGDEVGDLSRFLTRMTERLRASVTTLREAERRAAFGDLARQVNHDIRNGCMPIRNVVRHLAQVATEHPADLGRVFDERREHIESGIAYLEELSASYARITPPQDRRPVDLNSVVRQVCEDLCLGERRAIRIELEPDLPRVGADPIGMRRIVENLVRNAAEALEDLEGEISVRTAFVFEGTEKSVVLTVADTGRGIPSEKIDHVFEHFYTTKAGGTGLGLSIVHRLVHDFGGRIELESKPDAGTRVVVTFPPADTDDTIPAGEKA
jgi:signal transduction histidine kinase